MMNAPSDLRGLAAREATDDTPLRILGIPATARDDLTGVYVSAPADWKDRLDSLGNLYGDLLITNVGLQTEREKAQRRADELQSSLTDMTARFDNAAAQLKEANAALELANRTNRALNDASGNLLHDASQAFEDGYEAGNRDGVAAALDAASRIAKAGYKIVPAAEDA